MPRAWLAAGSLLRTGTLAWRMAGKSSFSRHTTPTTRALSRYPIGFWLPLLRPTRLMNASCLARCWLAAGSLLRTGTLAWRMAGKSSFSRHSPYTTLFRSQYPIWVLPTILRPTRLMNASCLARCWFAPSNWHAGMEDGGQELIFAPYHPHDASPLTVPDWVLASAPPTHATHECLVPGSLLARCWFAPSNWHAGMEDGGQELIFAPFPLHDALPLSVPDLGLAHHPPTHATHECLVPGSLLARSFELARWHGGWRARAHFRAIPPPRREPSHGTRLGSGFRSSDPRDS